MDEQDVGFAREFGALYRELYRVAVRRIDDGRDKVSAETTALMLHLAQAGPMTLSEMAQHFGRAMSTLSAKVAALESQGWLTRQPDPADARRAEIWLSAAGHAALDEAVDVLDTRRLAVAAEVLDPAQRMALLQSLRQLIAAVPTPRVAAAAAAPVSSTPEDPRP
ncbi:MAG TPA: MarR family winged helix-turn-helix transcriptional regulator [Ideonella sp.]|uniref:MarR family winged helix-turn-helix transcriptional regulator n=1 Tax=Ideonella sp. TaxID=1929293 RepID=UPI002E2F49FD|nr:MarR family winged helix-turn-helix transcriptional regulator [Ideonella sp.]HEX5682596.1 MarR family winged helix-turn-helix transcriptional regulator [Ideonella sp.]